MRRGEGTTLSSKSIRGRAASSMERVLRFVQSPSAPLPKTYKVNDITRLTGLSRQTIHNYTQLGLLSVAERTPSGHRLYPEDVFQRLAYIEMLKRHRSLNEVKRLLNKKFKTKR